MRARIGHGATARVWQAEDGLHIDVRGLAPPTPMVEILRLIEAPQPPDALTAHLDREPIYFYPELDARGWSYDIAARGDEGFALLLKRDAAA